MTYGILKWVNHKNKLYKELMKLNRNSTKYNTLSKSLMYIKMFYENESIKRKIFIVPHNLKTIKMTEEKHGEQWIIYYMHIGNPQNRTR